jgi:hypothetical protein
MKAAATAKALALTVAAVVVVGCSPVTAAPQYSYAPLETTWTPVIEIVDPIPTPPVPVAPEPAVRVVPDPKPIAVTPPKPKPVIRVRRTSGGIHGVATWYCLPGVSICTHGYPAGGAYGAAGPELRRAFHGHYKGKVVYVNGVKVTIVDFCACGGDHVIDVYHSTWTSIPNQSHVTITW